MDFRHALRTFARAPGFTLVVVLTLALGIGSTTTLFSLVYGVLLRPLPYPDADRVVRVWNTRANGQDSSFSPADYLDVQREVRGFHAVAGMFAQPAILTDGAEPVRVAAAQVTPRYFDVFGVPAARGRTFADRDRGTSVAVLADGAWREQFGGDPAIIGRTIHIDRQPYTVVGVMPRGFAALPDDVRLWRVSSGDVPTPPLVVHGDLNAQREVGYMDVVARVAGGTSLAQVNGELRALATRLARQFPDDKAGESFRVEPLREQMVADVRLGLLVLFGAVGAVLLIAGANVAGLLLARAAARRREFAVRSALGASRARLVRQLLVESVLLATAGGAVGLGAASWGLDLLKATLPRTIPRVSEIALDPAVVLFAAGVSIAIGLLFGTAPAWIESAVTVGEALKDGGRAGTGARQWSRRSLVVTEVAVALVLLASAGLLVGSLVKMERVDPGFRAEDVAVMQLALPQARYDGAAQARFYESLVARLAADGRVQAAAVVFPTPLVNNSASAQYQVDVGPRVPQAERPNARLAAISAGYFSVLRIPVLRGRPFTEADMADGATSVIVNRAFAGRHFPGMDPIGHRVLLGEDAGEQFTIVGVVGDIRAGSLAEAPDPMMYLPVRQLTLPFMRVMIRSRAGLAAAADALKTAVRAEAPDLPVERVEALTTIVSASAAQPRFRAWVVTAFAAAALVLAALGLYGLISYSVTERVREFGVRLALGATPREVLAMVLREGLGLTGIGLAIGVVGALAVARAIASLLYETSASDPLTLAGVALVLALTAVVACALPARRAMRVDPIVALRVE